MLQRQRNRKKDGGSPEGGDRLTLYLYVAVRMKMISSQKSPEGISRCYGSHVVRRVKQQIDFI